MRRALICGVLYLGFTSATGRAFAEGPVAPPSVAPADAGQKAPAIAVSPGEFAPAVQSAPPASPVSPAPSSPAQPTTPEAQPKAPDAAASPVPIAPDAQSPAPPAAPAKPAPVQSAGPAHPSESMRDSERLPRQLPPPEPHGPFVRAQLGVGVALLTTGSDSKLRLPSFAHLDLGYQLSESFAVALRIGTWLSYSDFAIAFVGVGVTHGIKPEGMFVTGMVGLSFLDPAFGISGDEERQGLAFHIDVGQHFTLAEALYFSVGAHFELGTPLGASALEFTGVGAGPFVSIKWGG